MKKIFLLVVFLLFIGLVNGMRSPCELQCGQSKNMETGGLLKMKEELGKCRPNFLTCANSAKTFSLCQKEYFDCKWTKTREIKEKGIQINKNYDGCINTCDNVGTNKEISLVKREVSSFCFALAQAQNSLISNFGKKAFEKILQKNGCGDYFLKAI